MSTEIESVYGVAQLRITGANEVAEVGITLDEPGSSFARADFLAAVAAECGVIIVDRAELPEVECNGDEIHAGGLVADLPLIRAEAREAALEWLAIAEHLGDGPSVDEAQVEALAGLLDEDDRTVLGSGEALHSLARRLVARGVRVEGGRA